ncbi:MAG: suppressor of fused domain protein [Polyangiaceae bacterium]|nr:suppressor of fused domain protein [Polyangiaceae bacterium]
MGRLQDKEVDELADAMEAFAPSGTDISFASYECVSERGRRIGIMRLAQYPRPELRTCASFGLAHNDWTAKSFPDRVELVQAWNDESLEYERLTVTVAEAIIGSGSLPKPGVIYENAAVAARLPALAKRMPHALLLFPYLWDDAFEQVKLSNHRVWFLQVVPLFDDEKAYIERNGFKTFEELLGYDGAHFHKLDRVSHLSM